MTQTPAASRPAPGLTAMCIDDSLFDLKLNERILSRCNAFDTILKFPSALDALAYLRAGHRPDVIFLDVNMPMMDGFEFLEAACAEFGPAFNSRVVVMLTSSLNPRDRERALRFAAVHSFLSKPITIEAAQQIATAIHALASPGASADQRAPRLP